MPLKAYKKINQDFFKTWSPVMSYLLGYIVADGCVSVSRDRRKAYTLNITSKDKLHLYHLRRILKSEHKISKKSNGAGRYAFVLQARNQVIAQDLIHLGVVPKKTFKLTKLNIPEKYFSDFVRGFFDGDGTVYIYFVRDLKQIKANFVCVSFPFFQWFNRQLCRSLGIPTKRIHSHLQEGRQLRYNTYFYIEDCMKLYTFMYNNATVYLSRKKKIFEQWQEMKKND